MLSKKILSLFKRLYTHTKKILLYCLLRKHELQMVKNMLNILFGNIMDDELKLLISSIQQIENEKEK